MKHIGMALALAASLAAGGCGGGGGGSADPVAAAAPQDETVIVAEPRSAAAVPAAPSNALPVTVDSGPLAMWLSGRSAVNTLYATVTVCSAGDATACETIDHVLVDTGSTGLRLIAGALSGKAAVRPLLDPATGSPLRQCVQFADGYTWGSVGTADVRIGGRTLPALRLNVIGDPAAGATPPGCVSGPDKNAIARFGANGVLGVSSFVHDCGAACVSQPVAGTYYVCPAAGAGALCRSTAVPLDHQLPNPVAALASDNNGVTIRIPPVPGAGSAAASGTLYFGVGTAANNALGNARLFTLDRYGTLLTAQAGTSRRAIIDSGTNAYVFTSSALATCTLFPPFYCPTVNGVATSSPQSAAIMGRNGLSETVAFTVDNIDQMFTGQAALPGLAAPSSEFIGGAGSLFAWGLPFFFGRTVHVLFEGKELAGTTGPAVGF